MADGILIIDKPAGWTSMDVCAKLRGIFHEKRVGHGGTLDPMATGVLPVFIGRATRAVQFAEKGDKEYIADLQLGLTSDTQDSTGTILSRAPVRVSRAEVEAALPAFTGDLLQTPPMYSAVKIQGKKLYQLARKGKEVERPARPVTIRTLEVLEEGPEHTYKLRVLCSKGTYVRTLCHDIGARLGCGAVMTGLRRTMAAGFTLAEAVTLEQVQQSEDPAALLRGTDTLFSDRPALTLTGPAERKLRNGMTLRPDDAPPAGEYRVYGADGAFLALCRSDGATLQTIKSFFNV